MPDDSPKRDRKRDTGFGVKLRHFRQEAGLTLEQLGDKVGMAFQSIARLEREENQPGWPLVIDLAAALDKTPNDFLPDGTPPPQVSDEPGPKPKGKRK